MIKYDFIYILSYSLFLAGAAMSFRKIKHGFKVMAAAVLMDFFSVTMPFQGFKSLAISVETDILIITGTIAEIAVWLLFISALLSRVWAKKMIISFDGMISVIKILWFVNLVTVFYGVYDL